MTEPTEGPLPPEGRDDDTRFDEATGVTYRFPVHIEIVGKLDGDELHRIAQYVFEELDATLRGTA
ncbi:hypothetical protein [Streptomyces sp. NPDC056468]|uniref:hypothetical protein n=1 Tax=Streptomyces sp. NPDC056468 TaxID=3345830 RepID=UPI00368A4A6F